MFYSELCLVCETQFHLRLANHAKRDTNEFVTRRRDTRTMMHNDAKMPVILPQIQANPVFLTVTDGLINARRVSKWWQA